MAEQPLPHSKPCTKCGVEKLLTEYTPTKRGKFQCKSVCKSCSAEQTAKWTKTNPDAARKAKAIWYKNNRESELSRAAKWKAANFEKRKASRAEWNLKNPKYDAVLYARDPERHNARKKAWRLLNPEKTRQIRARSRFKRRLDPQSRLNQSIRAAVVRGIRKGSKGECHTFELLGYDQAQLKIHLERQFARGMSWENYGEWHVDHILPLASFRYETPDDQAFKAAWALYNLRPLWKSENHQKRDKRLFLI